jgi:hypothetical protein
MGPSFAGGWRAFGMERSKGYRVRANSGDAFRWGEFHKQNSCSRTSAFQWDGSAGTASYDLWVDNNDAKARSIFQQGLTKTSFAVTTPLDPARYSAWVRGARADGTKTNWSPVSNFIIFAALSLSRAAVASRSAGSLRSHGPQCRERRVMTFRSTDTQEKILGQDKIPEPLGFKELFASAAKVLVSFYP